MNKSRRTFLAMAATALASAPVAALALDNPPCNRELPEFFKLPFDYGYPYRVNVQTYGEDAKQQLLLIEDKEIYKIIGGVGNPVALQIIPASQKSDRGRIKILVYLYRGKGMKLVSNTYASTSSRLGPPGYTSFRYPALSFDLQISQVRR